MGKHIPRNLLETYQKFRKICLKYLQGLKRKKRRVSHLFESLELFFKSCQLIGQWLYHQIFKSVWCMMSRHFKIENRKQKRKKERKKNLKTSRDNISIGMSEEESHFDIKKCEDCQMGSFYSSLAKRLKILMLQYSQLGSKRVQIGSLASSKRILFNKKKKSFVSCVSLFLKKRIEKTIK